MFSTDPSERLKTVDIKAEACIICHSESTALSKVPTSALTRLYTQSGGQKVLGLINPIENEKECFSSGCHAHKTEEKILGVLDVVISFDRAEKLIRSNTRDIVYGSVALTAIISLCCGFFITVLVNRPIRRIHKGMREIGQGNLTYRITLDSSDELGLLAARFNDMSSKLDVAHREIREWSESLNTKVNEKTEELKKVYEQIVQIEKLAALGKLSATVAHELNNPLEGILTFSKLISRQLQQMQKDREYSKILEHLGMISEESVRCGRIVKDLLVFSHRDEEMFMRHDLHTLIRKALSLVSHHLEMNRIVTSERFEADRSDILCDPQKIQQAVLALFMNAIEAIGNNGRITVETRTDSGKIVLRIGDNGSGIREKDLPHIYEPFFTTKSEGKGTGLGLAVVYGIVTHHHGSVDVEKTSPEGTAFRIVLPLADKPGS